MNNKVNNDYDLESKNNNKCLKMNNKANNYCDLIF